LGFIEPWFWASDGDIDLLDTLQLLYRHLSNQKDQYCAFGHQLGSLSVVTRPERDGREHHGR
jgi:hypothetical protein